MDIDEKIILSVFCGDGRANKSQNHGNFAKETTKAGKFEFLQADLSHSPVVFRGFITKSKG